MRGTRRFSQAISEGDGISLLADVDTADAARTAETAGAEGFVVRADVRAVRAATELPILWCGDGAARDAVAAGADAYLVRAGDWGEDEAQLERRYAEAADEGLDCVVEVRDEDQLRHALDRLDPEILLLPGLGRGDDGPLAFVLGLLADVPAGKLVIAALDRPEREDVVELERAGVDAAIVQASEVATLLGGEPTEP